MRNLIFLPILLVLFASCSQKLVPLTNQLRNDYALTPEVMPTLQYYVSKEIIFTGDAGSGERTIKKGVIYDKKKKNIDEVIIEEETPGICLNVNGSSLEISFDERDSPLDFGVYPDYFTDISGKIAKRDNSFYRLKADYWGPVSGEFVLNGKPMHTPASNQYACLLVDLRKISQIEKESRIARGRTVK